MKSKDHPLHNLLPKPAVSENQRNLRKISEQVYLFKNTMVCKTERAQSFFTFKFFH